MSSDKKEQEATGGAFREDRRISIKMWEFTLAIPNVKVFFTCRQEGVSKPPYDSFNLGFHVGDDAGCVHKNRLLLGRALEFKAATITSPRQRHSTDVGFLDSELDIGTGSGAAQPNKFDPCDALVTSLRQAPLLLHFADCVPVVLLGESGGQPVISIAHAGRKGLTQGIVANTVAALKEKGVAAESMVAAIGPAIGPCCYEVDEETATAFSGRFGPGTVSGRKLDLKAAVIGELEAAGLSGGNIHNLDICTSCDEDFFSYRRDGPETGRQGAIAWIE